MTTSLSPQRVLSNKSTLIGIAVPTPTRKDGTPIPLADTPPEGFQKVRVPRSDAPSALETQGELPRSPTPPIAVPVAPVITQRDIDAAKAAANSSDPTKVDASTRVTRRDLPIHGASRASIPGSSSPTTSPSSNPPAAASSRWLMIAAAVAIAVLGGRWLLLHKTPAAMENAPPTGVQIVPPAPAPAAPPAATTTPESTASAAPPASAAPAGTDANAPEANAPEAAPAPADSAAPAGSAAAPEGTRVVIVTISPPQARLFRKGKPVGSSPVRIELAPDEKRRSFEVGAPGWRTRKLVVDGTKPEIFIGLKPETPAR